jgi:TonB family protein
MRFKTSSGIMLAFAIAAAGCDTRPAAEIDAARASLEKAAADAREDAAESLRAAEEANAALEAELAAQDARWVKSYERTRQLAESARTASEKAVADAAAERERDAAVKAAAAKAEADARATLMTTAVRVGGPIRNPVKVKDVTPEYPPLARSARVGGTVQIEATVGPDGKVADARVVRSMPLLDQAALDAVRQWEYRPTRLKGVPVPVIINVGVTFQP